MKTVRIPDRVVRDKNAVVTVGTFDGIHLAHREIIREVANRARMREGRSVLVTFDPHPKEVVTSAKGTVRLLTTLEERIALLEPLGIDLLLVIPFTKEFSRLSPAEFFSTYIVDSIGVSEVVVGYNHMFGRDREAGTEELVQLGRKFDFSVFAVHPYTVDSEAVSSTKIRKLLAEGEVERARRYLSVPYSLTGTVVRGDGRGKTIGFPTANLVPVSPNKVIPGHGVYAVMVTSGNGVQYGMLNIGVRPTLSDAKVETVEVHLFEFSGDLYGQKLTVAFLSKLREERRFGSAEELTAQLWQDKVHALQAIAEFVKT